MLATNFNSRIEIPIIDEGAAYGAAMLAAIGSGMEKEKVLSWYKTREYLDKDDKFIDVYNDFYNLYKSLYKSNVKLPPLYLKHKKAISLEGDIGWAVLRWQRFFGEVF